MFGKEEWRKPLLHFTEVVASFDLERLTKVAGTLRVPWPLRHAERAYYIKSTAIELLFLGHERQWHELEHSPV
jgi:hypothetical protein